MAPWSYLIKFATEEGTTFLAGLDATPDLVSVPGLEVTGYRSLADLEAGKAGESVRVHKVSYPTTVVVVRLAALPRVDMMLMLDG